MKILTKIIIITMCIALVCIISLSTVMYFYSGTVLKDKVANQLEGIATSKSIQLNTLIAEDVEDLEELSSKNDLQKYMLTFHPKNNTADIKLPGQNGYIEAEYFKYVQTSINEYISPEIKASIEKNMSDTLLAYLNKSGFSKLSIIYIDGVVDLSTDKSQIKKVRSQEIYTIRGLNHTYIQNYGLPLIGEQGPIISTPIKDTNGNVLGVLVGVVDMAVINDIMTERSGLGDTGETLLINKNRLLITKSRFRDDLEFKRMIYTQGVDACLAGNSDIQTYLDYRGVAIIGAYKWIPERESCIVSKIDMREVIGQLNYLIFVVSMYGLFIILLVLLATLFFSRSITIPLGELVRGTQELSSGNLNYKVNVRTTGEIKILVDSLNKTGAELLKARELEKNYSKQLELQLAEKISEMKRNMDELELSKKAALNILEDLSEINTHLKELDQAKTDFLNIASHELKTPLTAISAYLEILDDYKGQFNEQQLQGLDAIKRNSNQLKTLINNILEVSRLESGRFELSVNDIDIVEKTQTILGNLKILSDNKGLELKHTISGVSRISTDEMRYEEILNNLVGNAIKFTSTGSICLDISAGTGPEEGMVVFSLTDTGVGIPESKMSNLFQNFYQVDSGISRRYGGTGLGLAITKKMVELQGGKISVNSTLGVGTTFRFTLPIKALAKKDSKHLAQEQHDLEVKAANIKADNAIDTKFTEVSKDVATPITPIVEVPKDVPKS